MGKISLFLGAGLLVAAVHLFEGTSATNTFHGQPAKLDPINCLPSAPSQLVELGYKYDRYWPLFVPLDGKPRALEPPTDPITEPKIVGLSKEPLLIERPGVDTQTGQCTSGPCEADPYSVEVKGHNEAIACDIVSSIDEVGGTETVTLSNKNGTHVVRGYLKTISCHSQSQHRRDLTYHKDSSANSASSRIARQLPATNVEGCYNVTGVNPGAVPDSQRIDWYFENDNNPYTLYLPRDGKPYHLDPPQLKCAHWTPPQTFTCAPCNNKFWRFDIDTRNTVCEIKFSFVQGTRDARAGYGWWGIETGAIPQAIGCWPDADGVALAEYSKALADGELDMVGIKKIERPVGLPPAPEYPTSAEDFVVVD
ncbi:hypothetical protein OHC33_005235 [Knufia fluminis]|uniref:Uncharacterized protein n=1 Tax=Knufia fluminis TaxID=191047 RepID=A0AAN8ELB4_9EURO|nr:hypothetical protein OHC33_005235 [Knufia fluminis]